MRDLEPLQLYYQESLGLGLSHETSCSNCASQRCKSTIGIGTLAIDWSQVLKKREGQYYYCRKAVLQGLHHATQSVWQEDMVILHKNMVESGQREGNTKRNRGVPRTKDDSG